MRIHVFDTHVTTKDGRYLHFDILVTDNGTQRVKEFMEKYLATKKIQLSEIDISRCEFCHTELGDPETLTQIRDTGFRIIDLN